MPQSNQPPPTHPRPPPSTKCPRNKPEPVRPRGARRARDGAAERESPTPQKQASARRPSWQPRSALQGAGLTPMAPPTDRRGTCSPHKRRREFWAGRVGTRRRLAVQGTDPTAQQSLPAAWQPGTELPWVSLPERRPCRSTPMPTTPRGAAAPPSCMHQAPPRRRERPSRSIRPPAEPPVRARARGARVRARAAAARTPRGTHCPHTALSVHVPQTAEGARRGAQICGRKVEKANGQAVHVIWALWEPRASSAPPRSIILRDRASDQRHLASAAKQACPGCTQATRGRMGKRDRQIIPGMKCSGFEATVRCVH